MRANDVEYFAAGAVRRRDRDEIYAASPASADRASLQFARTRSEDELVVTGAQDVS